MTETREEYLVNERIARLQQEHPARDHFPMSYTATLETVAQLSDLAEMTGKSKSQLIRDAIASYHLRMAAAE